MVSIRGEGTAGFSDDPKNKKQGNCTLQANLASVPETIMILNLNYLDNSSKMNFWEFSGSCKSSCLLVKSNFGKKFGFNKLFFGFLSAIPGYS